MGKIGKLSFVLAPVCLFASFLSSAVLQSTVLMSVFIVPATLFLLLAIAGKIIEARKGPKEDDPHD